MDNVVELSGVEDAFQAGKRLFAEGNLERAHEKLVLACVRAPQMDLYRLHEQFVAYRLTGQFADPEETRALAVKLGRDETTAAFASYVLGYVAIEEGQRDAATRHFDSAFRLDRGLLDAGRQLRRLSVGKSTPSASIQVLAMPRSAAKTPLPKARSPHARAHVLLGVLAVAIIGTVGYVAAARASMFSEYVEVR